MPTKVRAKNVARVRNALVLKCYGFLTNYTAIYILLRHGKNE